MSLEHGKVGQLRLHPPARALRDGLAACLRLAETLGPLSDHELASPHKKRACRREPAPLPELRAQSKVPLLLLLRSIASPQKMAMVQAEVARRGLETWK